MYTRLNYEILALLDLAKSFDTSELVAEIHELCYDNEDDIISDILHNYWFTGDIEESEREALEWMYVLAWSEDGYNE